MVNFFANLRMNVCIGKGCSHDKTNDQIGIICYSFELFSKKKSLVLRHLGYS